MKSLPSLLGYIPKKRIRKAILDHETKRDIHSLSEDFGLTIGDSIRRKRILFHEEAILDLKTILREEYVTQE